MRLKKILFIDSLTIEMLVEFLGLEEWTKMEAVAQTLGLHLRYVLEFQKHVFLMSIKKVFIFNNSHLTTGIVKGVKKASSKDSALYTGQLFDNTGNNIHLKGNFIFVHRDFYGPFKKDPIISHFKGLFTCLNST